MKKILPLILAVASLATANEKKPNIVYILADDMGYGDVQALSPKTSKILTPHMDKLAKDGMSFTDAHTCSSVCTPTRYGLLTGRYNWRTRMQRGVLNGKSAPLIPTTRTTVANVLKDAGYNTAIVGKWHLGLKMPKKGNWKGTIEDGPIALGFDYWYGISASLDFPPYIYIHNDKYVGEATAKKAFHRPGPAEPSFEAVDVLDELGKKSVEYIAQQNADQPYFLYLSLTSPHTPIVPTEAWKGKSGLGDYGDFMMQTDDIIGKVIAAVDATGKEMADNTLIIVSSDNGCAFSADIPDLISKGHSPNGIYRGKKMELWDGGHRVPHIVRWPAVVKPGTESKEIICLNDFIATCSEITGRALKDNEGEDSVSFLSALKGKAIKTERKGIVHHSFKGKFAYRSGKWKIILNNNSGGIKNKPEDKVKTKGQLYDMVADPSETNNLYAEHPEIVSKLLTQLENDVKRGRSTPGANQKNDSTNIRLW